MACSYGASREVIGSIIEAYPKGACIPDHLGAYALHKMCDFGCSVEALRVVLQYPEACSTITKVEGYFQENFELAQLET